MAVESDEAIAINLCRQIMTPKRRKFLIVVTVLVAIIAITICGLVAAEELDPETLRITPKIRRLADQRATFARIVHDAGQQAAVDPSQPLHWRISVYKKARLGGPPRFLNQLVHTDMLLRAHTAEGNVLGEFQYDACERRDLLVDFKPRTLTAQEVGSEWYCGTIRYRLADLCGALPNSWNFGCSNNCRQHMLATLQTLFQHVTTVNGGGILCNRGFQHTVEELRTLRFKDALVAGGTVWLLGKAIQWLI